MSANSHTFVMADLAGYTALTEAHGDEGAADAAAEFFEAARALLAEHGAEEVKTIGDAILARVTDAAQALQFAERLVCGYGARHRALGVRAGVHRGGAVERNGDWFGTAVNLTARITDAAEAGEVLISAAAAATAQLSGSRLVSRGVHQFRNVSEPVEVMALDISHTEGAPLRQDPVCRMALEPGRERCREMFQGEEYVFCSPECHSRFKAAPARYATASGPELTEPD